MRHLREDAEVESLLGGGGSDPCLREVMQGLRALAASPGPSPTGELQVLLTDGFVGQQRPAPKRRLERARRWSLRTAVLAAPLGLKIAGATVAAAATFGGLAAGDALPAPVESWVDSVIERVSGDREPAGAAAAAVAPPLPASIDVASRDDAAGGQHDKVSPIQPEAAEPMKRNRAHDVDGRDTRTDRPDENQGANTQVDPSDDSGATVDAPQASQPSRPRPTGGEETSEDRDGGGTDEQQDATSRDRSRDSDEEAADDARDADEEAAGDAQDAEEEAAGDAQDAEEEAAGDAQDAQEEAADAAVDWLGVVTSFNASTNQLVVTRSNGTTINGKLRRGAELSWDNDDCRGTSDADPSDLQPGTGVYDVEFEEGYIDAVALHCSAASSN